MVDERNKRGRPPKKPKPPEVEEREKQLLQQKIMLQVQQGFAQQAAADGLKLNITTSISVNKNDSPSKTEVDLESKFLSQEDNVLDKTPEKTEPKDDIA